MTPIPATGFMSGIDRSRDISRSDPNSFYDLLNLRYTSALGRLETTPYFSLAFTPTASNYINVAGSTVSSGSSSLLGSFLNLGTQKRYYTRAAIITDSSNTVVPVYTQTACPTGATPTKGCYVTYAFATGFSLGDTLDIVIDAATTFKWRFNGGAYTTGVAITTTGVTIAAGAGVTVYFLAASGFTVSDTWTFQRTDRLRDNDSLTAGRGATEYEHYRSQTYFLGTNLRLMLMTQAYSNGTTYVTTVGYQPIYGSHFRLFEGHVFVFGYSTTPYTSSTSLTLNQHTQVVNSDNVDMQCFISTDTNEADSYTIPVGRFILGSCVVNTRLFIITLTHILYTDYIGLPTPFDIKAFTPFAANTERLSSNYFKYADCCTAAVNVIYITASAGLFRFDGMNLRRLSDGLYASNQTPTFVVTQKISFAGRHKVYDSFNQEIVILVDEVEGVPYSFPVLYVYQERWNTWYKRSCQFAANTTTCLYADSGKLGAIYTALAFEEDVAGTNQPVKDDTSGSIYTVPRLTTQAFVGNNIASTKEIEGTYIVAGELLAATTTYYTTGSSIQFALAWYRNAGPLPSSPATDANAVFTTASVDGLLSYPRLDFKSLVLEITVVGTSAKPAGPCWITHLEPNINNITER